MSLALGMVKSMSLAPDLVKSVSWRVRFNINSHYLPVSPSPTPTHTHPYSQSHRHPYSQSLTHPYSQSHTHAHIYTRSQANKTVKDCGGDTLSIDAAFATMKKECNAGATILNSQNSRRVFHGSFCIATNAGSHVLLTVHSHISRGISPLYVTSG
jgi:hypothetical protein